MNGETGKPISVAAFDIPPSEPDPYEVELEGGNSSFLYISGPELVLDTRTRLFYEFPKFCIALVCAAQCKREYDVTSLTETRTKRVTKSSPTSVTP